MFHPSGHLIAVGFSTGLIKLLNSDTLEDVLNISPSIEPIRSLKFSYSGLYLAAFDSSNHVILIQRYAISTKLIYLNLLL